MSDTESSAASGGQQIDVFYDGACPLCQREITFYRKKAGDHDVRWVDLTQCSDADLPPDLTRDQAMARFHVRTSAGAVTSGAEAFAALWRETPGFRWLGRLIGAPPTRWVADLAYNAFLLVRPAIQRLAVGAAGNHNALVI